MRAWHGLVERIKAIPVSVVMQLGPADGPITPPDAGTAKRIAQDLKNKMLRDPGAITFTSNGYTFLVMGDPRQGGQQMKSPLGLHAAFDPPSSRAGAVTPQQLIQRVEGKARKYRGLAEAYGVPLIVAVGAHRFTGVTLGQLDDVLTGLPAPKITLQFNSGDPYIGEQTVDWAPVAPWTWPDGLDGLLWIDNKLPFALTVRPNPTSRRSMPQALTGGRSRG
jgi:hypothetical protein